MGKQFDISAGHVLTTQELKDQVYKRLVPTAILCKTKTITMKKFNIQDFHWL